MAEITANSSLIQGSNRSGEAGCVLHDVREEEIVFRRVKTVMTINGVNGVHVMLFVRSSCTEYMYGSGAGSGSGLDESSLASLTRHHM